MRTNEIVFIPSNGKKFVLALTEDGLFDPTQLNPGKPRQGFVRLQPPFEDTRVWHMGIVLAAQDLGLDLASAIVELKENQIVLAGTNGVVRAIPVDADGYLLVDWTMTHKDDRLTKDAFETLVANDDRRERGEHPPDRFRDKLVVVGSTATGNELTDRGATPLENDTFLTSSHWNVMNAMLTDRFIRFTGAGTGMLLICLLGAVGAFLTLYLRPGRASASVLLLAVAYMLLTVLLFNAHRLWLPLVMPLAGLFLTNLALVTYRVGFEQKERRHIKSVFDKIVSPNIVEELLDSGDLALGGARRKITVCFADVRGFTEMTDQHHAKAEDFARQQNLAGAAADNYFDEQAAEVLRTVNLYLGRIADMVKQHAGTLDKYIGDCVMAFWGAPTPNEQHACAAVRAAIDAQRAVYALNQERFQENKRREQENVARLARGELPLPMLHLLSIGTGINTGMMTVGLMGSDKHIVNYTVFGREVNLAQRLESYSGRSRIIIGEATFLDLQRDDPALAATCVELAPEIFRGFRTAVKIYEVPWKQNQPELAAVKDAAAAGGR